MKTISNYYVGTLQNFGAEKPTIKTFKTKKDALRWFDATADSHENKRVICYGEVIAHSFLKNDFCKFEIKVTEKTFD